MKMVSANMEAADRLIVALDVSSRGRMWSLVEQLEGQCRWFKVGLQLYLAEGPRIVTDLRERGFEVFLDLKLHDIPQTVSSAIQALVSLDASLLTIHALGGRRMLEAAREAAAMQSRMRLLAVTVLTSLEQGDLSEVGVQGSVQDEVLRLGGLASSAGVSGLVCSPLETRALRSLLGPGCLLVVPGIRSAEMTQSDDQRRTATPGDAIRRGASMIVVGRPINQASDPARAFRSMVEEMERALQDSKSPAARRVDEA